MLIAPLKEQDPGWSYLNTPVGVLLYLVDSKTGDDDASMCATSQLIVGHWILTNGAWADHPPAEPEPCPDPSAEDEALDAEVVSAQRTLERLALARRLIAPSASKPAVPHG